MKIEIGIERKANKTQLNLFWVFFEFQDKKA